MKYAFSANRHASKYRGIPCLEQIAFTAAMFAIETGCPPPALFVTVSMTSGMRAAPTLADMVVLRRGNRLSITPVTPAEWRAVNALLAARTMTGRDGITAHAIDHGRLLDVMARYGRGPRASG